MSACKNCGSDESHASQGETVCSNCGVVLEASVIISEVQFHENAAGVSTVVGQFISFEASETFGRDSRRTTLLKAKDRIRNIANQLGIGERCIDMAFKLFKLALSWGLTRGRRSNNVAAACLYTVCRMERKPIMLLDFSDKLGVDVFTLGHTYLKLSGELHISVPALDPCIYIERFARRLEFGDKTMDVCRTATRLASRMDRDWLALGRRPSGVCGAALLVAARIFNFSRSVKDVVKVVRISRKTIKSRLSEFARTPSSELTVEEFHVVQLEDSTGPPCFEAERAAEEENEGREADPRLSSLLEEAEMLRAELEEEIRVISERKFRRFMKFSLDGDSKEIQSFCSTAPSLAELNEEMEHYRRLFGEGGKMPDGHGRGDGGTFVGDCTGIEEVVVAGPRYKNEGDDQDDSTEVPSKFEDLPKRNVDGSLKESKAEPQLGVKAAEELQKEASKDDINLTGIDDDELNKEILSEDEVRIKTIRWMRENVDHLREMKEKEEKRAKELLEKPELSNKAKKKRRRPRVGAATAREAVERIVCQDRGLADKIDCAALMEFDVGSIKSNNNKNYDNDENNKSEAKDEGKDVDSGSPSGRMKNYEGSESGRLPKFAAGSCSSSLPEKKIKIDSLEDNDAMDEKEEEEEEEEGRVANDREESCYVDDDDDNNEHSNSFYSDSD